MGNPKPVSKFKIGNKAATKNKGTKTKKTKIKIALGLNDPEKALALRSRLDEITTEFLNSDKKTRMIAWKEILKYVYTQKKTMDVTSNGESIQSNVFVIPSFVGDDDNSDA